MKTYKISVDEITSNDYENLSPYRRSKADRYKNNADRLLCVAGGVLLDKGLKEFSLCEKDMEYSFNEHNKPSFKYYPDIHFNISHSGKICIAVFSDKEIGCDVQKIGDLNNRIVNRCFTTKEQELVNFSKNPLEDFYKIWTMKESYVKAKGTGLSCSFNSFCVFDIKDYAFKTYIENGYAYSICEKI